MKDLIGYGFKIMALSTELLKSPGYFFFQQLQVTKKKRKKAASRFRK